MKYTCCKGQEIYFIEVFCNWSFANFNMLFGKLFIYVALLKYTCCKGQKIYFIEVFCNCSFSNFNVLSGKLFIYVALLLSMLDIILSLKIDSWKQKWLLIIRELPRNKFLKPHKKSFVTFLRKELK